MEMLVFSLFPLLLSSDSFLISYVNPGVIAAIIVVPFAVVCYLRLGMGSLLSPGYRAVALSAYRGAGNAIAHRRLLICYVVLFLFTFVQTVIVDTLTASIAAQNAIRWLSVLGVLVAVTLESRLRREPELPLRGICIALLIYGLVNALFLALGVRNPAVEAQFATAQEGATMLQWLGVNANRSPLPIGNGVAPAGMQAGLGIVLGLTLLWVGRGGREKLLGIALTASSVPCVLATDARTGAFGSLAVALAVCFIPFRAWRNAKWIAVLMPLLPLGLLVALVLFPPLAEQLSRSSTGAIGALTGRPIVWAVIVTHLARFNPVQLIGYGVYGQVGSGVSQVYGPLFKSHFSNPTMAGAHNMVLQTVLDMGYLGTLLLVLLFYKLLDWYGRQGLTSNLPERWLKVGLAGVLYLVVVGITTDTLSTTVPISLVTFLVLNLQALNSAEPVTAASGPSRERSTVSSNQG